MKFVGLYDKIIKTHSGGRKKAKKMKKIEHPEEIIPSRETRLSEIREKYARYNDDEACDEDEFFMDCALEAATVAGDGGDVPVGCAVVRDGRLISVSANGREVYRDATYHAECAAISEACNSLGGWRLVGCTMYVTLEPCPMCAGAIVNARVPRVVIGAKDVRFGAMGSLFDLTALPLNHKPETVFGVRENECRELIRDFFRKKR